MNEIVYSNPRTQIIPIQNNFYLALNPCIENGQKIINEMQLRVLQKIGEKISVRDLSKATGHSSEVITHLIDIFSKIGLCSYSKNFTEPSLPKEVNNIDFWVHTTNRCNLNCPYCYIDKKNGSNMSDETADQFVKELIKTVKNRNLSGLSLRFSGGEPFIRFGQIKKCILSLKEGLADQGCKTNIGFLTNLTLLNKEIIDFIKQENLYTSISLDGFGQYHDNSRFFNDNNGSFTLVDKNINYLLEHGHQRIIIMTVLSNRNLDGLPEFAHYIAKKNISFRFSVVTGEAIDKIKLRKKLLEAYDIFEQYIKDSSYKFSRNHHLDDLRFFRPAYRPCSAGLLSGSLNTDGKIYFCQQELGQGADSGSLYDDGDLIEKIQTKDNYHSPLHGDCNDCPWRYVCSGGCPLYRENGKSPHCELYKELLPRIYQLIGLERIIRLKSGLENEKA